LGKIAKKARHRARRHEKLTEYDKYLIEQYDPPGHFPDGFFRRHRPAPLLPGGITYVTGFQTSRPSFQPTGSRTAPPELISAVARAYFHLRQDKKRLNERAKPATSNPAASASLPKFVRNYIANNPKTASQTGCRKAWKFLHGDHRRRELDAEWQKQAEPLGLLRARGQTVQIAQSKIATK
jgi:hypothetical protein